MVQKLSVRVDKAAASGCYPWVGLTPSLRIRVIFISITITKNFVIKLLRTTKKDFPVSKK